MEMTGSLSDHEIILIWSIDWQLIDRGALLEEGDSQYSLCEWR